MEPDQVERRHMMNLPKDDFEKLLLHVAELGARQALSEVGLDGPSAANDIRELRGLLDAFNAAKRTAGLTIIKMLVTGLVMLLLAGAFVKLKLFGGHHDRDVTGWTAGRRFPAGARDSEVAGSKW